MVAQDGSPAEAEAKVQRHFRPGWLSALRHRVVRLPAGPAVWRIGVAVAGALIIAAGIVMLPLPGPGWAVIFIGLGLWATEFRWAQRLLLYVRRQFLGWTGWLRRQRRWVHVTVAVVGLAFTAAVLWVSWSLL